uniref:Putative VirE domain containing protein n=1 Tax=viral metagenome TaxID=1070528 RepID=A0A6M3J7V5_9ZZZZ
MDDKKTKLRIVKPSEPPPPEEDDPGPAAEEAAEVDNEWMRDLLATKKGGIINCVANACVIVEQHPELAGKLVYNERSLTALWKSPPPWGGSTTTVTDADAVRASKWVAKHLHLNFADTAMEKALKTEAMAQSFDPVCQYLDGLRWDGHPRTSGWLSQHFGAEPSEYTRAIGQAWLISAVARAFEPGCKADYMLIIEGPQGIGKTESLRALAGDEFFAEVSIDPANKDTTVYVHGPWIVEWGEMAGLSRREADSVKAFISRRVDRFRPPYARNAIDAPRRLVFAGTINEKTYLNDPTGNRRYWPFEAFDADPVRLAEDRDQLWAEAAELYQSGASWWLTGDLAALAEGEQLERADIDSWDEPIAELLAFRFADRDFVSVTEIYEAIGIELRERRPSGYRRISHIMRSRGWTPKTARLAPSGPDVRGFEPAR